MSCLYVISQCLFYKIKKFKAIALCSSYYEPHSLFICSLQDGDVDHDTNNSKKQLIIRHELSGQHDRRITSFDWSLERQNQVSPNHNGSNDGKIVTLGEDCRIFVWTYHAKNEEECNENTTKSVSTWNATQVLLQQSICLTPLDCSWDILGEKFAVGMGGNHRMASIEICSFDNGSWSSREIGRRKIKSSVLCLGWRPNFSTEENSKNSAVEMIACGGCDCYCRIFIVNNADCQINNGFGFGEQCAEFDTEGKGWVISLDWSQSGKYLAFSSRKSCVFIVDCSGLHQSKETSNSWLQKLIPLKIDMSQYSPMRNILFLNDTTLVTGGYNGEITTIELYCKDGATCEHELQTNNIQSSIISLSTIELQQSEKLCVSGSEGYFDVQKIISK